MTLHYAIYIPRINIPNVNEIRTLHTIAKRFSIQKVNGVKERKEKTYKDKNATRLQ